MKYTKTFAKAYQDIYENAAAREIDTYANKLGKSSMDYTMFKKFTIICFPCSVSIDSG